MSNQKASSSIIQSLLAAGVVSAAISGASLYTNNHSIERLKSELDMLATRRDVLYEAYKQLIPLTLPIKSGPALTASTPDEIDNLLVKLMSERRNQYIVALQKNAKLPRF